MQNWQPIYDDIKQAELSSMRGKGWSHLVEYEFVFVVEQSQVGVDEVEVVLWGHVVTTSQFVLELAAEDAHQLMHSHYVSDQQFAHLFRYQRILRTNHNELCELFSLVAQAEINIISYT